MGRYDDTIWYHVYPLGAVGAPIREPDGDGSVQHRLPRLLPWIDHAADLGCTGLLLAPVFASSTHGYDTIDHFRIDPRLGDDGDFDRLVAHAADRGMAVLLDGVFNHVGRLHPWAQTDDLDSAPLRVERAGDHVRAASWEGNDDLVELDHADPRVDDLVVDVMGHWLDRGVAGWRLDVAYAVPPEFWRRTLARVRERHPDALFLGEVIHGDYPAIAAAGTLDSVTQYELWKGIWSSLHDANLWELAWALTRHDEFSRTLLMQTFVGNHDVARIASTVGDAGAAIAAVVLLTVPGMPSIYYGDERAFRGEKGTGASADDALRPALPGSPLDLGSTGEELQDLYRRLIALRRDNPWLTRAQLRVDDKTNERLACTVSNGDHELAVRLHLGEQPHASVAVDGHERLAWP